MTTQNTYKIVTAPLDIEEIKDFFNQKNTQFLINCFESKIKGEMLLTYISNLELPCNLILDKLTKDEKFELLKTFFHTKSICNVDVLTILSAQVILRAIGAPINPQSFPLVLTEEELTEFIMVNEAIIRNWIVFITSSMVFQLTCIEAIEEKYQFKSKYSVIDDPNYVGHNVVNLFSLPMFTETFFSVDTGAPMYYFKRQFEDYMFSGNNFFHFFSRAENLVHQVFEGVLSDELKIAGIEALKNLNSNP